MSSEYRDTIPQHICQGESFEFDGVARTQSGFYTKTDTAVNGCDSVTVLHLFVHELDTVHFNNTICLGENFQLYGFDTTLTTSGTHLLSRTVSSEPYHCDSTIIVTLTVREPVTITTIPITTCPTTEIVTATASFDHIVSYDGIVSWTLNGTTISHPSIFSPTNSDDSLNITIPTNLCNDTLYYTVSYSDSICSAEIIGFVYVVDTVSPVITGTLPDINLNGCPSETLANAYNTATEINALENISISDICTPVNQLSLTYEDDTLTSDCHLSILRTYTVTDLCGNSSTITQNILITRPSTFTISQVDTVDTIQCESMATADQFTLPIVTDACDSVLMPSGQPTSNNNISNCEGTKSFTYIYTHRSYMI